MKYKIIRSSTHVIFLHFCCLKIHTEMSLLWAQRCESRLDGRVYGRERLSRWLTPSSAVYRQDADRLECCNGRGVVALSLVVYSGDISSSYAAAISLSWTTDLRGAFAHVNDVLPGSSSRWCYCYWRRPTTVTAQYRIFRVTRSCRRKRNTSRLGWC